MKLVERKYGIGISTRYPVIDHRQEIRPVMITGSGDLALTLYHNREFSYEIIKGRHRHPIAELMRPFGLVHDVPREYGLIALIVVYETGYYVE